MSVWHGILLLVRAGSFTNPHVDSLSSVNDEDCNKKIPVVHTCGVLQAHMEEHG